MMRKPDISTLIHEKLKLFDQGLRDRQLIHPQRDWFIGLATMGVLIVLAGWWSGQTYLNNYQIEPEEPAADTGAVVYRGQLVAEVLATRQDDARKFNQLLEQSLVQQTAVVELSSTTTTSVASSTDSRTTTASDIPTNPTTSTAEVIGN